MVYEPKEDSEFLATEIKGYINYLKDKDIKVLDMGSGTGIQAKACIEAGVPKQNILAADMDPKAIDLLKKSGFATRKTDLFSKIKVKEKFDLIVFNPPYLPEDKHDKEIDTTAGKKGYEIIIRFLKQAKLRLNKNGRILLLISSLSKPNKIKKYINEKSYTIEKILEKKLFFESLFIYHLS